LYLPDVRKPIIGLAVEEGVGVSARRAREGATPAAPAAPAAGVETPAQLNDRGTTLFREKRYAEALDAFQDAAKRSPSNALIANHLGYAYFKLERFDPAVEWFEKTVSLDPRRAIAYANLADAYLALGKRPEAKKNYERYLELQPTARYAATVKDRLRQLQ
jgi:Flp pilus assembly protein TadD